MYTHEGPRKYLTAEGDVVDEGDVRAATLLIGPGSQLPLAEARRYGLVEEPKLKTEPEQQQDESEPEPSDDDQKAAQHAAENKAKKSQAQNKAGA